MPKKDFIKEQEWIKKLDHFKDSGLTAMQWCEQNHEKIHRFKYWKSRLNSTDSKTINFEEIAGSSEKETIKITRKDYFLELPIDSDEKTFKLLLQAIRGC